MLLRERLTAQLLAGPRPRDPVAVTERLLAIQAQDPRGARLAIRARSAGLTAADVDRALSHDRSLVVTWLNRGTLHLIRSEDYPWLQALTPPPLHTGNARRLAQEGVSPDLAERGVAVIERSLATDGPLVRARLRERLASAGVPTAGQALVHLLMAASLRGILVRGPMVGQEQAFVLAREWLGEPRRLERDDALAELARRYLAGHGPAGDRDLARWSGLPLRDARAGLAAIAPRLDRRPDGLVALGGRRRAAAAPRPRLLGAFDPVLLGWTSRDFIVGPYEPVLVAGGLFRPFLLVDGRAAGTWNLRDGRVTLDPFRRLPPTEAASAERDAADVVRFLGG
ncbi:MAG TPA: winged helix DNA-binding domain-containing protein [Actinomycetota bacterium]|nr:winged helix DNA-binding domain-containing protein [Actinomycetota bacterium]